MHMRTKTKFDKVNKLMNIQQQKDLPTFLILMNSHIQFTMNSKSSLGKDLMVVERKFKEQLKISKRRLVLPERISCTHVKVA